MFGTSLKCTFRVLILRAKVRTWCGFATAAFCRGKFSSASTPFLFAFERFHKATYHCLVSFRRERVNLVAYWGAIEKRENTSEKSFLLLQNLGKRPVLQPPIMRSYLNAFETLLPSIYSQGRKKTWWPAGPRLRNATSILSRHGRNAAVAWRRGFHLWWKINHFSHMSVVKKYCTTKAVPIAISSVLS